MIFWLVVEPYPSENIYIYINMWSVEMMTFPILHMEKKNMFQTTNQGWGVQLTTILFRSLELITSALPLRTDQFRT